MQFLKELLVLTETTATKSKTKKKKDVRDKSADRYPSFVAGNMLFTNVCSGELSGTKSQQHD